MESALLLNRLAKNDTCFLGAGWERCFTADWSCLTDGIDGSKVGVGFVNRSLSWALCMCLSLLHVVSSISQSFQRASYLLWSKC